MKVVDIANEIYLENASPSDTSIPAIAFWIRSNVGKLNNYVYESYSIDAASLEIVDSSGSEIQELAAAILKEMYKIYRIELDIRANINAVNNDSVLAASDEGFSVRRVNRSELLKTLTSQKRDALKELETMVGYYRSYNGAPSQVAGDDTVAGVYPHNYNAYERIY